MNASAGPAERIRPSVWIFAFGYGLSGIGDQVWYIGLSLAAASLGDPGTAGLVVGLAAIPRALLSLIGGAVADRLPARTMMIITGILQAVVLFCAAGALGRVDVVWVLCLTGFMVGLLDAFHDPAIASFQRSLVRKDSLVRLAAINQLLSRIAVIGGPPIAGLLFVFGGIRAVVIANGLTFVLAAAMVSFVRPLFTVERMNSESVLQSVASGIREVRNNPVVRRLVVALSGLNVFLSPVTAVGLALLAERENWSGPLLGIAISCIGIGALAGALVVTVLGQRIDLVGALVALAAQAFGVVAIALAGPFYLVIIGCSVIGFTSGVASPVLSAAFQRAVDPRYIGRVASILSLADDLFVPLSIIVFGFAAKLVGLQASFLTCACLMFLLIVWGLRRWRAGDGQEPADQPAR